MAYIPTGLISSRGFEPPLGAVAKALGEGKSVREEHSHISVRTYPYGYREEEFNIKTLKKLVKSTVFRLLFYVVLYLVLCKMLHWFVYFNYIKYS